MCFQFSYQLTRFSRFNYSTPAILSARISKTAPPDTVPAKCKQVRSTHAYLSPSWSPDATFSIDSILCMLYLNDLLKLIFFRHLNGESVGNLTLKELKNLENRLEKGIGRIRSKKVNCSWYISLFHMYTFPEFQSINYLSFPLHITIIWSLHMFYALWLPAWAAVRRDRIHAETGNEHTYRDIDRFDSPVV